MDSLHKKDYTLIEIYFCSRSTGLQMELGGQKHLLQSRHRSDLITQMLRTYYHEAWGQRELMHLGAYWDPGMEFGQNFDRLDQLTPGRMRSRI
jgi:hypothetical protein